VQAIEPRTSPNISSDASNALFAGHSCSSPLLAHADFGTACVGTRLLNLARAAAAMHMAQSLRHAAAARTSIIQPTGA
jgi:hypothetical protein